MAAISIILPVRADEARVETLYDNLPVYKAGKYLTFRVARHDFAMHSNWVHGILPVHEMTALEAPHAWIRGFASIGGRDFPVIDLRAKLGISHGTHGREPFIVVIRTEADSGDRLVGFIADRVSELVEFRARDFRRGRVRMHGRPRQVLQPDEIMAEADWTRFWVSP